MVSVFQLVNSGDTSNDTTHPGLSHRFFINYIPARYAWIYLVRLYAICYNGCIKMKFIDGKFGKNLNTTAILSPTNNGYLLSIQVGITKLLINQHEGLFFI